MIVLGVETATPVSSVALWRDGEVLAEAEHREARRHVEFLMPAVRDLLARAQVGLNDVDVFATGLGPGQFTGMRAGIATVKALAMVLQRPVVGVCTLDVLAWPARAHEGPVWATIDAKRGQIFAARYRAGARDGEVLTLDPETFTVQEDALVVGNGLAEPHTFPRAADMCEMAAARAAAGDTMDAVQVEPMYVRRSDAEINWEARGVAIQRPLRVKPAKRVVEAAGGEQA